MTQGEDMNRGAVSDGARARPTPRLAFLQGTIMASAPSNRPLSPHLQVYRWQITMAMSILHRATGVGLGIGTLLIAWWLIAAAAGPDSFETVQGFIGSFFGQLILFGFTAALFYHLCNGIRHLVWDTGNGFTIPVATKSGIAVIAVAGALTVLAWIAGYIAMPGS